MALNDWDARLLSPQRALQLAGDAGLYATVELARLGQFEAEAGGQRQPDQWQINLRCTEDRQSVTMLGHLTDGDPDWVLAPTSIGDLLAAVIRHRVTAHDLSLSGGGHG